MPFDFPTHSMTPTDRARRLRHQGKSWAIVAASLAHRCSPQERVATLKRVHREEFA